jgi:predicted transcriptional regulator
MPKNVTISLPDELGDAMAKLPEVNWSAVARDAIENYVTMREKPDLAEVVQQLVKQRGAEFAEGVQRAKSLAKAKGNAWLDALVREYNEASWEEMEKASKEQPDVYGSPDEVTFTDEYEGQLMHRVWKKRDSSVRDESDAFMTGFKKAVLEIHEMVRKSSG